MKLIGRMRTVAPRGARRGPNLPARLRHTGNETGRSELAKGQAGNLETANESAAPAGHLAAIDHPRRAGVPGQLREADVILFRLQLSTEGSIFRHRLALAFIAIDPRSLRHKERGR